MTGARPTVTYGEWTFVAGDSYVVVYESGRAPKPYGDGKADVPMAMLDYPRSLKRCHLDQPTFEAIVFNILDEVTG